MTGEFLPPDWGPLERALAREFGDGARSAASAFWFVGFVDGPADVGSLRLYEHHATHRQLALDADGGAWRWDGAYARFAPVDAGDAFVEALV